MIASIERSLLMVESPLIGLAGDWWTLSMSAIMRREVFDDEEEISALQL